MSVRAALDKAKRIKIIFKIDRMDDGALVIYTSTDDRKSWVRQGYWPRDANVVSFEGGIDVPLVRGS